MDSWASQARWTLCGRVVGPDDRLGVFESSLRDGGSLDYTVALESF